MASSTATMPVTYACLRERVGLRERSASLGALVGSNFNNDGTALYEAMAALFIAQVLGMELGLGSSCWWCSPAWRPRWALPASRKRAW